MSQMSPGSKPSLGMVPSPEAVRVDYAQPSKADVERQLARILAHPLFRSSQRLTAFLRFIVDNTLAGRAHEVKEYVIGADVFGLGESYNPQKNPVVRIVAG